VAVFKKKKFGGIKEEDRKLEDQKNKDNITTYKRKHSKLD